MTPVIGANPPPGETSADHGSHGLPIRVQSFRCLVNPFVHKFQTDGNKYIYDVNSNRVFRVSDIAYEIIDQYRDGRFSELTDRYPQFNKRELKRAFMEIRTARKDGIFSSDRPLRMGFAGDQSVEDLVRSRPYEQLILNVTERCNLRCRYCVYGGCYRGMRKHGGRDMSFDTAKSALHQFLSNADEECAVSFYGGEPLLNIDLIMRVVAEAESCHSGPLLFSMTTNGTMLDPGMMDYLRQKNFSLLISLDGPAEVHDLHRRDVNGNGSFDRLMGNLDYLYTHHREYYDKMVSFSTVSVPPGRLETVRDFFADEPRVRDHRVTFSFVEGVNDVLRPSLNEEDVAEARSDISMLRDEYLSEMKHKESGSVLLAGIFGREFARFYHRPKTFLGPRIDLNGCCIPGSRRLFVTVDGVLHVCERLDNAYSVGSVQHWIDPKLVRKLVDDYLTMSRDCLSCWACRICSECFARFYRLPDWSDPEARLLRCEQNRRDMNALLVSYYTLVDEDPSILDFLEHVTFT